MSWNRPTKFQTENDGAVTTENGDGESSITPDGAELFSPVAPGTNSPPESIAANKEEEEKIKPLPDLPQSQLNPEEGSFQLLTNGSSDWEGKASTEANPVMNVAPSDCGTFELPPEPVSIARYRHATPQPEVERILFSVFDLISSGETISGACKEVAVSRMTFYHWLRERMTPALLNKYIRARELQAHAMVDQGLAVARDGSNDYYVDEYGRKKVDYDCVKRCAIHVGYIQWMSARMLPGTYGDRTPGVAIQQNFNGDGPAPTTNAKAISGEELEQIREARRRAKQRMLEKESGK